MANPVIQTSELMNAVRAGSLDGVLLAIAHGADVEESDMHGHPGLPLRTACFAGHYDIVLTLLDHGANVNAPTAEGNGAPLRLARRARHQHIASLLLERGAELPYDDVPAAKTTIDSPAPRQAAPSEDKATISESPEVTTSEPVASGIPGDLRRHPRPESNVIEFTSFAIPATTVKAPDPLAHGNSIEFTREATAPAPTPATVAPVTAPPAPAPLPDFSEAPPAVAAPVDLPDPAHIEEIEMSVPYGVDTDVLARELSRLAAGADIPPGGKSGR